MSPQDCVFLEECMCALTVCLLTVKPELLGWAAFQLVKY